MSQQQPEDLVTDGVVGPPETGDAAIDDALIGLAELASTPLHEHHEQLSAAHQRLQSALDRSEPAP